MRAVSFINKLVQRFSEMDESENQELYGEAQQDYKEALAVAKSKVLSNIERGKEAIIAHSFTGSEEARPHVRKEEILTWGDKAILKAEKWYVRYGFAVAYIILIPIIRGYMAGNGMGSEDDEGDSEAQMLETLRIVQAVKQMKKA